MINLSVFDVDRTLTRAPTYTAFLVFGAWHRRRWRLMFLPVIPLLMAIYSARLISRKQLKESMHRLLLGERVPRDEVSILAKRFAHRLVDRGLYGDGTERLARERAEGRRVILASAASDYYLNALADLLGLDAVVATRSSWRADALTGWIDGENCYGPEKLKMLERWMEGSALNRAQCHVRVFSDHHSDQPVLAWADEAIVVNPKRVLAAIARRHSWTVVRWR